MTIHKEGYRLIFIFFIILASIDAVVYYFLNHIPFVFEIILVLSVIFYILVISFFRKPKRELTIDENKIYAPCDGKVVVIEETEEGEYFKDKRIQVSIFMSPLNVHINWYPISGIIKYFKYHSGQFLVAWHPKSSTYNERTTTVIKDKNNREILVRQIAGAVARRIVPYAKEGIDVIQGEELGFIKFGSRVDLFLPIGTKINVNLEQKVSGNQTVVAEF